MKNLKLIGTVLSREEQKKIQWGTEFTCLCFSGTPGSGQITGWVTTSDPLNALNWCSSNSTYASCRVAQQ